MIDSLQPNNQNDDRPTSVTNVSGGVKVDAEQVNIGGDVVGRDKIIQYINQFIEPEGFYAVESKLNAARIQLNNGRAVGHDFYNGTEPNWLDIVAEHDAPRDIENALLQFVHERAQEEGKINIGLIIGRAGDGKTTALMRIAANLVGDGYLVLWHKRNLDKLNSRALEEIRDTKRVVICIDDTLYLSIEEVEGFLRHLHTISANVLILMTVRDEFWFGSEPVFETVTHVTEFPMRTLSDTEIRLILDKLTIADELGELQILARNEQEKRFRFSCRTSAAK